VKVVADEWMSLDGVVQSPSGPDEDAGDGFRHGGWHMRYFEPVSQQWVLDGLHAATAFLYGRRTYEAFAAHWPTAGPEEQMVAEPINSKPRYLASRTLRDPLPWSGSSVLEGDAVTAVAKLRAQGDGELHVVGSADLVRRLLAADQIDELRLMIDPVLLGSGKRLFPTTRDLTTWRLASSVATSTGALLTTYARG
jgi:dihydrofolate reductase